MRTPHPNAIAYQVTAKRNGLGGQPFRRCGRDFPRGEVMRVSAEALTEAQREYLLNSDPRDLVVEEVVGDLPEEGVEDVAPSGDAPMEPTEDDESESDDLDGEDDEEPSDGASAEGADSATSAPPPAQRRKKKGKRR
jgi:hypothetical protein